MTHKNISVVLITISTLLHTSCSNNTNKKTITDQKGEISPSKSEAIDHGNFDVGTWRIDSVGENNQIVHRLTKDSIIQVFNFRKNGVFSTMEIQPGMTKERESGTWKIEKDSVFILSTNGRIAMRYGYAINGPRLILNGNFLISSTNRNKPSFYLSKYITK